MTALQPLLPLVGLFTLVVVALKRRADKKKRYAAKSASTSSRT